MNFLLKKIAIIVGLAVFLPMVSFAQPVTDSNTMSDHESMMSMDCASDSDCEKQRQSDCIEHCIDLANVLEKDQVIIQHNPETTAIVKFELFSPPPTNHSRETNTGPPTDPRIKFTTVQRE